MNPVIDFPGGGDSRVISTAPLRLRWGEWRTPHAILVHVQSAAVYEDWRDDALASGTDPSAQMPSHFALDGGLHETAHALLRHRGNESKLIDVTYLSLLMETLVNTPCAILRTDLIRRVYREVDALSAALTLRWRGRAGHFMLPLNQDARDPGGFERTVAPIAELKALFNTLRDIAATRLDTLKKGYVIYFPRRADLG